MEKSTQSLFGDAIVFCPKGFCVGSLKILTCVCLCVRPCVRPSVRASRSVLTTFWNLKCAICFTQSSVKKEGKKRCPTRYYSNVQKATFALSISKWRKGKKWERLRNTARLENIASIQNSSIRKTFSSHYLWCFEMLGT